MFRELIISLLLVSPVLAQIPEAPQPAGGQSTQNPPARFLTFRKSYQDPPLRSTRQVFTSKKFILLHAALAIAIIYDVKSTHGVREDAGSEYPVIPAIIGLDYVVDRFFCECFSVEAPIYAIQHYARDALR